MLSARRTDAPPESAPATASTDDAASRRRRYARWILAALVVVHLVVLWLFALHAAQTRHIQQYLGARESWRSGDLATAARDYRAFATGYADETAPFKLRRNYPTEASAWFALGRIEAERGRVDAALEAFGRSMALETGRGRREYRDLLLEAGRPAALVELARAELVRDPRSAVAWWDLGAAWLALGRPADAVRAYDRALAFLPELLARKGTVPPGELTGEEADLVNLRAVARLLAGDRPGATADCDALGDRQPAGADLDRLCTAFLLHADGRLEAAAERLRTYQAYGPEHEALLRRLDLPRPKDPAAPGR